MLVFRAVLPVVTLWACFLSKFAHQPLEVADRKLEVADRTLQAVARNGAAATKKLRGHAIAAALCALAETPRTLAEARARVLAEVLCNQLEAHAHGPTLARLRFQAAVRHHGMAAARRTQSMVIQHVAVRAEVPGAAQAGAGRERTSFGVSGCGHLSQSRLKAPQTVGAGCLDQEAAAGQ